MLFNVSKMDFLFNQFSEKMKITKQSRKFSTTKTKNDCMKIIAKITCSL